MALIPHMPWMLCHCFIRYSGDLFFANETVSDCYRRSGGDGPHKGGKFPGDCCNNRIATFASGHQSPESGTQPHLAFPGDLQNVLANPFVALEQQACNPRRVAVGLGCLDQDLADMAIAGLGNAASLLPLAA